MTTIYETLRDAIYALLNGIDDIGQVHKQRRWTETKEGFKTHYALTIDSAEQIRAWSIRRISTMSEAMTRSSYQRTYLFELEGFMGLKDSLDTEQTFEALCDTVMDTFDALRPTPLGGVDHQEPIDLLEVPKEVLLSGFLCHHAVLRLTLVWFSN